MAKVQKLFCSSASSIGHCFFWQLVSYISFRSKNAFPLGAQLPICERYSPYLRASSWVYYNIATFKIMACSIIWPYGKKLRATAVNTAKLIIFLKFLSNSFLAVQGSRPFFLALLFKSHNIHRSLILIDN